MSDIEKAEAEEVDVRPVENTDAIEAEEEASEQEVEESAASEDDATEGEEKPKRRSRAEERINALTREKYEAQKQAEAYQRQLSEIQQYFAQQQANSGVGENMPTLADYGYDEQAYGQAIRSWNESQIKRFQENQQNMLRQQQQMQQVQQEQAKLAEAMARGQEKYPDFVAKVNNPQLPPLRDVNPSAFQAVMESDAAVDVAYYLASNPQEVYALASMSPVQAIKHVAKLEGQLSAKPKASNPLPKPPSKVSGNSEAAPNPQKMSTAEWMEWRNAQISKR